MAITGELFLLLGALGYAVLTYIANTLSHLTFNSFENVAVMFLCTGELSIRRANAFKLTFPIYSFVAMITYVLVSHWLGACLAVIVLVWGIAINRMQKQRPNC